ncbi:MAG: protein-disulfide reductase DsbD family protein [Desulfitobacteriaceae bacterium]|jgi:thiol:disulfide interchange protein DsbD|nr:protein-disulfide reductase DsbD family protein [Desulfitobacteriaceae bacterium]
MKINKFIICLACLFLFNSISGLANDPVKWTFKSVKVSSNTFEIHFIAKMNSAWHIYSQESSKTISSPTIISIDKNDRIKTGDIREVGQLVSKYEEIFDETIKYYGDSVVFIQNIKVLGSTPVIVKGEVTYSACSGEQCLPPKPIGFSLVLNN